MYNVLNIGKIRCVYIENDESSWVIELVIKTGFPSIKL